MVKKWVKGTYPFLAERQMQKMLHVQLVSDCLDEQHRWRVEWPRRVLRAGIRVVQADTAKFHHCYLDYCQVVYWWKPEDQRQLDSCTSNATHKELASCRRRNCPWQFENRLGTFSFLLPSAELEFGFARPSKWPGYRQTANNCTKVEKLWDLFSFCATESRQTSHSAMCWVAISGQCNCCNCFIRKMSLLLVLCHCLLSSGKVVEPSFLELSLVVRHGTKCHGVAVSWLWKQLALAKDGQIGTSCPTRRVNCVHVVRVYHPSDVNCVAPTFVLRSFVNIAIVSVLESSRRLLNLGKCPSRPSRGLQRVKWHFARLSS